MNSRDTSAFPAADWSVARFEGCTVYRHRRELVVGGAPQPLEPRAFDVLVYLIQERHRVVSKGDILNRCWGDPWASDSALARSLMKVRQAIGDFDPKAPLIKTVHRVGYRFVARLEFEPSAEAPPRPAAAERIEPQQSSRRLALLPFVNATHDDQLGWIELGLMSMLGKALRPPRDISLVPTNDLMAALDSLAGPMTHAQKRQALRLGLGCPLVAWGEVTGGNGRFLLHFNLESSDGSRMHGAAVGSDLARIANQAAARIRNWLAPACEDIPAERDEFAHQAFSRALSKAADNRLTEAERLLDLVRDSGIGVPTFTRAYARVQALLGRPGALVEVQAMEERASLSGDLHSLALGQFLRSILHEQHGHLPHAISASRKAIELAESAGLGDELVEFMIHCAIQLGECFDDAADPMLSRAVARAEGLGNRALLLHAYVAAGLLASLRSDVLSCLAHTESAIAVAPRLEGSLQSMPYVQLGWSQLQLGQLDRAMESTRVALCNAETCGRQPELGIAAAVTARACLDGRRIPEALALHARLQAHAEDRSLAMLYAREVVLKASFLRVAGCFDAAMDSIAHVRSSARHHPVIEALCDRARLHVLLKARRFDELGHTCHALMESSPLDPRLLLWIEHARAFLAYLSDGDVDAALARMHEAMRLTPVCEVHARISLDAAWIHLERGEVALAKACTEHLQSWLEQSPEGRMVDARLRLASGDTTGAVAVQRRFCKQYAETLTHFHLHLTNAYELSLQGQQDISIAPLAEPLCLHWWLQPRALSELPSDLTVASQ